MSASPDDYGVNSYHVNIGSGDGAIHVLFRRGTPNKIERAVLIDGGEYTATDSSTQSSFEMLDQTLKHIEQDLNISTGASQMPVQVDSVVITHWDTDHYKGIFHLFESYCKKQTPGTCQLPFLKYDGQKNPLSVLYVPYWNRADSNLYKSYKSASKKAKMSGAEKFATQIKLVPGPAQSDPTLTFIVRDKKAGTTFSYEKLCLIRHTPDNMLGVDFFTNGAAPASPQTIASVEDLIANIPSTINKDCPGLFCIATDRRRLGSNVVEDGELPSDPVTRSTKPLSSEDVDVDQFPGLPRIAGTPVTTPKNRASIVNMLIWPSLGRISLYTGGDIDEYYEDLLVQWTKKKSGGSNDYHEIPTMKASHHGASGSFPPSVMDRWRPQSIIFSVGTAHYHPLWAVYFYISLMPASNTSAKLWSTCYPYYFRQLKDAAGNDVWAVEDSPKYPLTQLESPFFKKALKIRYDVLDPTGQVLSRIYDAYESPWTTLKRRNHLNLMLDTWSNLSTHTSNPGDAPLSGDQTYFGATATSGSKIWYIKHESRSKQDDEKTLARRNDGTISPSPQANTSPAAPLPALLQPLQPIPASTPISPPRVVNAPKKRKAKRAGEGADIDDSVPAEVAALPPAPNIAEEGEPVIPVFTATGVQGVYFFAKEPSVRPDAYHVVSNDEEKLFIGWLHRQVIGLTAEFPVDEEGTSSFLADDEVFNWMKGAFGATAELSATGTGGEIKCFDLNVDITTTSTTKLLFSTELIPLQFKLDDSGITFIPFIEGWGVFKKFPLMIFGLKSDYETTVKDLFQFAGFRTPVNFPVDVPLRIRTAVSDDETTHFKRNAIWFSPTEGYRTMLRLQLEVSDIEEIKSLFSTLFSDSFSFESADFILRKSFLHRWAADATGNVFTEAEIIVITKAAVKISDKQLSFTLTLTLSDVTYQGILDFTEGGDLSTAIAWIGALFGADVDDFGSWLPDEYLNDLKLSRITLSFDPAENLKLKSSSITFEVDLAFGGENPDERVVLLLSFSWPPARLSGSLWTGYVFRDPNFILWPDWEDYVRLEPKTEDEVSDGLYLANLVPGQTIAVPNHVLPVVRCADVALDKDSIYFGGLLTWNDDAAAELPIVTMDKVILNTSYNWTTKDVYLSLYIRANLNPRDEELPPADLIGGITYDNGLWSLMFDIHDLYFTTLASFFDADISDGVMDMIEQMKIQDLYVAYTYSKEGKANEFTFYGKVILGPLAAELSYTHSLSNWTFQIAAKPSNTEVTIGELLESISGGDVDLPSCVGNIRMTQSKEQDTFNITISKQSKTPGSPSSGTYLVFYGKFQVSALGFSYLQLKNANLPQAGCKRIIRLGVATLPQSNIPLVGAIPQPFEEMTFMWVEDTKGEGITREEVDICNNTLWTAEPGSRINFKDPKPNNPQPTDVVLPKGLHLIITETVRGAPRVILDHRFGSTRKTSGSPTSESGTELKAGSSGSSSGKGEVTTAPMEKKFGALNISNIGLQFINNTLYIVLDATFDLGPMTMSLLGFGIGVNFDNGFDLQNMPTNPSDLEIKLEGLAVGFERPPITMAGEFRYRNNLYSGGITVGFTPYLFLAAGFYGETPYKTVFVFAKLSGPLVTLAFAEISGICGGFGYNNFVTYPTVQQVPLFPFISDNLGNVSPTEALAKLTGPGGWVQPREDVFWLAAGMSVKAFRMLSLDTVVVIEFNPYVKLGLFALCQASLPPKSSGISFLFVELGITCVIDFEAGTMRVEGQLTPNSYVLAPSCHLTGGFALFYWFGNSQFSGDWVFTIGGYHPAYTKPAHFPEPPRLGISWSIDSSLSIIGQSYFAITPKCCMAGGRLHAALSLGPLGAWFDAQANFLIVYNPFSFKADAGVSVGVSFTLDLWICTIRISVEIGAQLYMQGPPFGGRVHVNFWVFGFDIEFGETAKPPPAVSLEDFWEMVLQDGVSNIRSRRAARKRALAGLPTQADEPVATQGDHLLTPETGLLPTSTKDAEIWDVRGGVFSFRVQSRFALNKVICYSDPDPDAVAETENPADIYSKPMQLKSPLSSEMEIHIEKENAQTLRETDATDHWQLNQVIENVPVALWGKYDASQDPTGGNNNLNSLLSPKENTMSLMMGVTILSPKPTLAKDVIPKFNFVHAFAMDVYLEGDTKPQFPDIQDSGDSFFPNEPVEGSQQWDDVQQAWSNPSAATAAKGVLDAWKVAFQWEEGTKVDSTPPAMVLENFGQLYMSAPLMCGAAAA